MEIRWLYKIANNNHKKTNSKIASNQAQSSRNIFNKNSLNTNFLKWMNDMKFQRNINWLFFGFSVVCDISVSKYFSLIQLLLSVLFIGRMCMQSSREYKYAHLFTNMSERLFTNDRSNHSEYRS